MKTNLMLFIFLLIASTSVFAEEIPVGVTRFRLDTPKVAGPAIIEAARYALVTNDALKATCPAGQKILAATCDSSKTSLESIGAVNRLLNSKQANVVVASENEISTATCNASLVRPDEVVKLSMTLKCGEQTVSMNSKKD